MIFLVLLRILKKVCFGIANAPGTFLFARLSDVMFAATQNMTVAELASLPDRGNCYELIDGELRMMSPAGSEHGRIAAGITAALWHHVRKNALGTVYAAETGFLLSQDPDTVRAPDVAFVRHERLDEVADVEGYLPLAPDLVVEVVSPNDRFTDVEAKVQVWLDAGAQMVLVVDPGTRTIRVHRTMERIVVLRETEQLDASDVVSGWKIAVADLLA
jgi:Uma2 family endonuclease